MADKERDSMLREMAQHRGFKLVKSRRRKPGGDFGRYGLKSADKGEECLGFGPKGLTASADEVESILRGQTASTWQKSLGAIPKRSEKKSARRSARSVSKDSAPSPAPPRRSRPVREAAKRSPTRGPDPSDAPKLRIRDADSPDSAAIADLVSEFSPTSADALGDRLPILRRAGESPIVARLGDEIVGIVTWHVTPVLHRPRPVGRITFLQVKEGMRRRGVGKALVAAAVARLEEKGCG